MSDGEVKRWEIKATKWDNPKAEWRFHDSEGPGFPGYDSPPPCIKVMRVEDHERIVAELKAEIVRLKRERAKYEADCKRIEYFDDLHEKVATQARVIEKLKRYTQHRVECVYRTGVFQYSNDCDCGLKAIEKGWEA